MRCRGLPAIALLFAGCSCDPVGFSAASHRDAAASLDASAVASDADDAPTPDATSAADASGPDGGLPALDAAGADGSLTEFDAASPAQDGSLPATDAAGSEPDAAAPGLDAASPGLDAAAPGPDAAAPGPDAAAPGLDASTPSPDSGTAAGCGKFELLSDDFADGVTNANLWARRTVTSGASVTEAASEVTIVPKANQNGSNYDFYGSTYQYDLTGSQVSFEVREVTSTSTTAGTFVKLGDNDAGLELTAFSGRLDARTWTLGTLATLSSVPYDPVAHARWRLREAAGAVYFETSPDGAAWTALTSVGTPPFVRSTWLSFGAGTYERVAKPGQARFGPVNGGVPRGKGCPAATLVDAFTGSSIGPSWFNVYSFGGASYSQSDAAILVPGSSAPAEAGFGSTNLFDLTAGSVSVAVPQMVSSSLSGPWAAFTLSEPNTGNKIEFTQYGGTLYAKHWLGGTDANLASVAYDPASHAAWRIREQGGQVVWETKGAGGWSVLFSEAAPFPPTALGVYLIAGSEVATASAGQARFDDLNLVP